MRPLVAVILISLLGPLVRAPAAWGDSPKGELEEPWIEFKGQRQPFHVLTNVPHERVLRSLAAVPGGNHAPGLLESAYLSPGVSPWTGGEHDAVGYYFHQADGVVALYLRGRVMEEAERRYHLKREDCCDPAKLEKAIVLQAQVARRFQERTLEALAAPSPQDAAGLLAREFPRAPFPPTEWATILDNYRSMGPYAKINFECFPPVEGDRVAQWYRDDLTTSIFKHELKALIDQQKDRVVALVDRSLGPVGYLVAKDVAEDDLPALKDLANVLTNPQGDVARAGVDKANQVLHDLGSNTRIEVGRATRSNLARTCHVSEDQLAPQKFVPFAGGNDKPGTRSYVYVYQATPGHAFSEYPTSAGSFAYDYGVADLLAPIVADTLHATKLSPGLHLPASDTMIKRASAGILIPDMYGEPVPDPLKR